ncbi:hypothetical protein [Sphingomonas sp. SORGH_AS_0879]|uniref:hypothetical protein n=1 Tax=Sphingomonas sp. SORGH_AS_0879 TaxID=3041790 RepID=UPI0027868776|nr:hypothetical protein [Sphingomonas sp. SORGH_AS_0879]MDQ1229260.1 hypothetical protein [Sphingomonas sp. SORGH_AS_0879]
MKGAVERLSFLVPGVVAIGAVAAIGMLPGCATDRDDHRLAEQAALSVELAYQAVAIGALTALHSGQLDAAQRRCIAVLDDKAHRAVTVARAAADRRDATVASDVATARGAIRVLLNREGC